jgi:hypothetical protein
MLIPRIFTSDVNTKNIYKLHGNQPISLTVSKGMSSYLNNNLNGILQVNDNPFTNRGVTGTYDFKLNEAIFTFRDTIYDLDSTYPGSVVSYASGTLELSMPRPAPCAVEGSTVLVQYILSGEQVQEEFEVQTVNGTQLILENPESSFDSTVLQVQIYCTEQNSFTLAFNDIINGFTSFYSFTPSVYINNYKNIWTPDSTDANLWIHDQGDYCNFYGTVYPSNLSLLLNYYPTERKTWDNLQWGSESLDQSGIEVPDNTFSTVRLYNEHQDSGIRTLPGVYLTKKERLWNLAGVRNRMSYLVNGQPDTLLTSDPSYAERFRSNWLFADLTYDNQNSYSFQVNTMKCFFRPSLR